MSSQVNLEISLNTYNEIISHLESRATDLDSYMDIEDLVHLIDSLEKRKESDLNRQAKETRQWFEQQKLLEKGKMPDGFSEIKEILHSHGVKLDSESEFHLICNLLERINFN